ncbi:MAG TPA: DUF2249 domain-containing protein [Planctomycetota bacterium]|nr:DUF2249 domain-containing protein [Planctomycetota bacterium]
MSTFSIPAEVAAAGVRAVKPLDVRPVLGAGGDPFQLIMKRLGAIEPAEALELIVPFEPRPLFAVLAAMGYATSTAREADLFHVFIFRDPAAGDARHAPPASCHGELKPPVELDVRDMEPPQPLIAIFEKLADVGPGAQLLVRHHREPRLLYDKLAARGYAARATEQADGSWLVHIAPEWAFNEEK